MRRLFFITAIVGCGFGSGCSSQQFYATGQNLQRSECNRLIDSQERQRCQAKADVPYETYRRAADGAGSAK